jgi:hypothetical protein
MVTTLRKVTAGSLCLQFVLAALQVYTPPPQNRRRATVLDLHDPSYPNCSSLSLTQPRSHVTPAHSLTHHTHTHHHSQLELAALELFATKRTARSGAQLALSVFAIPGPAHSLGRALVCGEVADSGPSFDHALSDHALSCLLSVLVSVAAVATRPCPTDADPVRYRALTKVCYTELSCDCVVHNPLLIR